LGTKTDAAGLNFGNFLGLQAFRTFNDDKFHFLSFIQGAVPLSLNRPEMHKEIGFAIFAFIWVFEGYFYPATSPGCVVPVPAILL